MRTGLAIVAFVGLIVAAVVIDRYWSDQALRNAATRTSDAGADVNAGAPDVDAVRAAKVWDEPVKRFGAAEVAGWTVREVDGHNCLVSPALVFPAGQEVNHHRVIVTFTGSGSVKVSVGRHRADRLAEVLAARHFRSWFRQAGNGKAVSVASSYKAERFVWLILRVAGDVKITGVSHTCWRAAGTLFGHVGRKFRFAGADLPYRLMSPKNFGSDRDPARKYPLVISVHGSGGVGADNVRSMEQVILAGRLFAQYYDDEALACYSLVPQIPSGKTVPAPYHPKGDRGAPDARYHPDWPAVNERGWYTQATLALIGDLLADKSLRIDPDRVYFTGFSYGGKACWEFLRAGPDVFAGAIAGGGWPVGRAFSKPAAELTARLREEVRRHKHVPVLIFAGDADPMRFGSRAAHEAVKAVGGASTYLEIPDATHTRSAGKVWTKREHVAWLFGLKRRGGVR